MNKYNKEYIMHYLMSAVGGFFGAYALLNRQATFGSSQTSNILYIFIMGAKGNFVDVLIRVVALLLFMSGFALKVFFPNAFKIGWKKATILIEIIGVIVLGFIPSTVNSVIALYPIFFMAALQWAFYSGAELQSSSTIFSTNNIRQFTTSICEYIKYKNAKSLEIAKYFSITLLSFHIGAVLSIASTMLLGIKGIWVCVILLVIAFICEAKLKEPLKIDYIETKEEQIAE